MQKSSCSWYIVAFLLVGGILMAVNAHWMRSISVDIAHHYSLVFRLTENWHLASYDPTLGEMNVYPRGSHMVAAFVGKLVGSPFVGMQLVANAALVLLWASCLAILYAAHGHTGPFNAIVMALVVILNVGAFRIHGAEISQNYFFAQLVAQALAMAAIAIAIRIEAQYGRFAAYAVFLAAIWPVTSVHLLPALELVVMLGGLLALDVAFPRESPRKRLQQFVWACLALGIALISVVLHPAFSAMRSIANNNGDISLGPLAPLWSVAVVCLIALACSLSLLRVWRRHPKANVMYRYLGVYGAAVAGLCLLQTIMCCLNIGSVYAAKKYAFAVVTFLFMRLAVWLGSMLASRASANTLFANASSRPGFAVQVFAVTLFATVAGASKMRHDINIQAVANFEHRLSNLPATAFPPPSAGRHNVILELQGMPNVVNYMFSLAIARTPRDTALLVLQGRPVTKAPLPLAHFGTIITSPDSARLIGPARCANAYSLDLIAIDAACAGGTAIAALAKSLPSAQ